MKLFGTRAGLLGGLFNANPASDGREDAEASAVADRLNRISQRGRQGASALPQALPPLPFAPPAEETVVPPGATPTMLELSESFAELPDGAAMPDLPAFAADETTGDAWLGAKSSRRSSGLGLTPMGEGEDEDDASPAESQDCTAIVFRQIFPPRHDLGLSFFGGLPIASPDFEWPRSEDGRPYSFVLQIDCAEVPARARRGFPGHGLLYVFMGLVWGAHQDYRVIHLDADGELAEIPAPDDLPALFGEEAKHVWKWPRGDEDLPRLLPKWRFQPVAVDLPADLWDEGEEDAVRLWPAGERLEALLLDAQGEEVQANGFSVTDMVGEDGQLFRPFDHFPHDARAVQIATGLLIARLDDAYLTMPAELQELPEEERTALLQRIREEAQSWFDDASAEPPFIEVPQEVADQYWTWLNGCAWLSRSVLAEALTLSVEASLAASAEAAARVPTDIVERVRGRHALAVRTDRGLHVNIPDRMLAPPVDVQGNQEERAQSHVLLLEMSSNEGLGHHFGEGVYQFWIAPEDLAAGRFDKVELTADAY